MTNFIIFLIFWTWTHEGSNSLRIKKIGVSGNDYLGVPPFKCIMCGAFHQKTTFNWLMKVFLLSLKSFLLFQIQISCIISDNKAYHSINTEHSQEPTVSKERKKWAQLEVKGDKEPPKVVSPRTQERKKWEVSKHDSLYEKLSEKTLQPGTYVVSG